MIEPKHYNTLRQIVFKINGELNELPGRFQGWGMRPDKEKNIITVAIIEDQDGKIHEVAPTEMRFIDFEYHRMADE